MSTKITLSAPALRAALALVKPVVDLKSSIPILHNVRITYNGAANASLYVTDMEAAVTVPLEAWDTSGSFDTLVPYKPLADLLRASTKASSVTLELTGEETLAVTAGSARVALTRGELGDYPEVRTGHDLPHYICLTLDQARDAFVVPQSSISTEETRYYLNGVCLDFHADGTLRAVATDGHRLTRVVIDDRPGRVPFDPPPVFQIIVPRPTVALVGKLLAGKRLPPMIFMHCSGTRIQIVIGDVTLHSKLIDGTFPQYDRVIPRNNLHVSTVPAGEFAASIKRVAAVHSQHVQPVRLDFGEDCVTVSARDGGTGASAAETLNGGSVTSPAKPLEVGFQARYLLDILAHCGDRAEFAMEDGNSPAVIHDPARRHVTHVLMPIRL